MKHIVALILAVLYLSTTSGMVINLHYCMGKIYLVTVNNFTSELCSVCGAKSKMGCCKTELKVVKLNEVHQQATSTNNIKTPVIQLTPVATTNFLFYGNKILNNEAQTKAPPLLSPPGIYIKNCVFLI